MKTNIFKIAVLLLVLAGGFGSCGETGKNTENESARIIGKWKLMKVTILSVNESNDYSTYNIVYEFKANGVLTVSGVPEQIELYRGLAAGGHRYAIIEDSGESGRRLEIDNNYSWHTISSKSNELIIDNAPLDGTTEYLLKIQKR